MKSTICYSIVSNFYLDFIPQWWGGIMDSNEIHFVFICDGHGRFSPRKVLKWSWKMLFERSFDCFLRFCFFFNRVCGLLEL